jgi:hypothetical protein
VINKPLDELYLTWLYGQIGRIRQRRSSKSYWSLARQLYNKEFIPLVPNDDNRKADGKELRYEFINDEDIQDVDPNWMDLGCSMLEMLIALSRRLGFETGEEPREWFWHMIRNVHLDQYNDMAGVPHDKVDDIIDRVIWRTYHPSGRGGLFPLKNAHEDQRRVELWYQLSAYLLEKGVP